MIWRSYVPHGGKRNNINDDNDNNSNGAKLSIYKNILCSKRCDSPCASSGSQNEPTLMQRAAADYRKPNKERKALKSYLTVKVYDDICKDAVKKQRLAFVQGHWSVRTSRGAAIIELPRLFTFVW
ncbi:unnamed protein product [Trichobilharzia regenti]|nr:unnamed protein product [Trichobilharzia regenti]